MKECAAGPAESRASPPRPHQQLASPPQYSRANHSVQALHMMEGNLTSVSDGQHAPSFSKRLPVNPRRHKVAPESRKRVCRACNACNNRRVKCTGEQPCQRCIKTGRGCEYSVSKTDRSSIKDELEQLRVRCSAMEEIVKTVAPHQARDLLRQLDRGESPSLRTVVPSPSITLSVGEPDEGGGRLLHDPDGAIRYLGASSGASFLDQLKQFVRTLMRSFAFVPGSDDGSSFLDSVGRYQTYDSRPLTNPVVDPTWLPDPPEMIRMLHGLRQYIQDGNGAFKSGGIHWWGDLSKVPARAGPFSIMGLTTDDQSRHLAFYHVCFALSVSIGHTSLQLPEHQYGDAYFKRARMLLGNPMDTVRFTLSDVPALSLMGYYLIEVNRRDAAYMYVSLAVHIAIIHGSFRHTADEASKRTFWTLYIMDRWISMLMGRPPIIPDEAIRLPPPTSDSSLPPCIGICANIELARISGFIVRETYGIAPQHPQAAGSETNIDAALKKLYEWRLRLPMELQNPLDQMPCDPACCTLHMSYNQLIILTTRPVFFAAVKKAVAGQVFSDLGSSEKATHETHSRSCTEAAQRNLDLARRLQSTNRNWLQSGLHFLFNAAVVLLLSRTSSACKIEIDSERAIKGPHAAEIGFAIHVFEQEAKTGTNYPRDCCRVLQDLRALTDRFMLTRSATDSQRSISRGVDSSSSQSAKPSSQRPMHGSSEDSHVYQEMLSWAQLDGLNLQDTLYI